MRVRQFLRIVVLLAGVLCALSVTARAETIDVTDNHGGLLSAYQTQWAKLAEKKVSVRVVGPCVSACTVLMGYIPRKNICVTATAAFGFHLATMQFATDILLKAYPADIRDWIEHHGGLQIKLLWLQAPAIYHFFHKCPEPPLRAQQGIAPGHSASAIPAAPAKNAIAGK